MKPLRILYALEAHHGPIHGGIETYGRELMAAMAARGHTIDVLDTTASAVYREERLIDSWPRPGFRHTYYLWKRLPLEDWRYHTILSRQASQLTSGFRPDVMHALHLHTYGAIAGSRSPCVVTAHGLEVEPILPVLGSARTADSIHAVSTFTANLVQTRLPGAAPVTVITWGIRPRTPSPSPGDQFDLITVSRLVPRKNVDNVLRALQSRPHLRYAIVGDGPELEALRELAVSLRLPNVSFFGAVSEQQRQALLDSSRVFIMCPLAKESDVEGLGLVYFEAFESGLPVIASNNGGVPDAVGEAALLVEHPEDPVEIGRAIDNMLSASTSSEMAIRVTDRQRTRAWEVFLTEFEQLYQRVAERRGSNANSRTLRPL